jgi:hypothetical protein
LTFEKDIVISRIRRDASLIQRHLAIEEEEKQSSPNPTNAHRFEYPSRASSQLESNTAVCQLKLILVMLLQTLPGGNNKLHTPK